MNSREAEELLPWYVAGTLSAEESRVVQKFIDSGEISERQLDQARFVGTALKATEASQGRPGPEISNIFLDTFTASPASDGDVDDLLVVPERKPALPTSPLRALLDAWRGFSVKQTARSRLATTVIAVQFAALAALGALLAHAWPPVSAGPPGPDAPRGDYTLRFATGVSETSIRALLLRHRASIVAGPNAAGLYTVILASDADTTPAAADHGATVRAMEASGLLTLMRPVPRP